MISLVLREQANTMHLRPRWNPRIQLVTASLMEESPLLIINRINSSSSSSNTCISNKQGCQSKKKDTITNINNSRWTLEIMLISKQQQWEWIAKVLEDKLIFKQWHKANLSKIRIVTIFLLSISILVLSTSILCQLQAIIITIENNESASYILVNKER